MVLLENPASTSISSDEKMTVSGVFIACCCIGITLALYPRWIRKITRKNIQMTQDIKERPRRSFHGHHPECERFQTHTITIHKKTWCTGCLGLLIGSLASIFVMFIYVLYPVRLSSLNFFMILFIGLFIIALIYIEIIVGSKYLGTHILSSAMLVPSFFLITMSVTELTGKMIFSVLTVLLCVLWLDTRVVISNARHRQTCSSCKESCKMYAPSVPNVERSL